MSTAEIVSLAISGLSLTISTAIAASHYWRFRHALEVTCHAISARNPDGTQRAFGHWQVRVLNVRPRPTAIDEIWFLMNDGATWSVEPEGDVDVPMLLTDHAPVDIVFDLDVFSTPGEPAQPRCAIAVDAGGRGHAGWIGKPPRLARLRGAPRRKVIVKTEAFVASQNDEPGVGA